MKIDADGVFALCAAAVILSVLGVIGWAIFGSIRSNGEADYCYTEMTSPTGMAPQFMLYAHRPWRLDRHLGTFKDLDELRVEAKMLDCPLNGKK
jgi:hypothetical protein